MSSLVNDFLINPVLRQARRFSRPSLNSEVPAPEAVAFQQDSLNAFTTDGEHAILEEGSPRRDEDGAISPMTDRPLVASPVDEDGGLDAQLAIANRAETSLPGPGRSQSIPLRLSSMRSDRALIDDDTSDNPSFTSHERFRNESSMSSSMSSNRTGTRFETTDVPQHGDGQEAGSGGRTRLRNSSLPEDDGMRDMRRKIVHIQSMSIDSSLKAQMMHQLLTEQYHTSQTSLQVKQAARPLSPSSFVSQERPSTPGSIASTGFWQSNESNTDSSPSSMLQNHFRLSHEDLQPTFAPMPIVPCRGEQDESVADEVSEELGDSAENEPALGCEHYKRNVKLQCSTCNKWYTCRFCHDAAEDHTLKRKETKYMLCMLCGCAQVAGKICINCNVRAAWYYCDVCKLWNDDVTKSIYHCDDCGICRVGAGLGKDYIHCQTCGVCILISKEHKCIERASDCDCPICGEYLFSSTQTVVFMKCGHTIHQTCYRELMKTSYKCPLCSQSVVNMEMQFRNLDRAIESQPMPDGFNDTQALVSCNDCYAKSVVKYHWLGLKCGVCDSYNTAQLQIMSEPGPLEQSGPAEEDIIPGPRADLFMDNMNRLQVAGRQDRERAEHDERQRQRAGSTRVRRHSHGHLNNAAQAAMLRFNPYPVPSRLGRSVSPTRGTDFMDDARAVYGAHGAQDQGFDEDEEDEDEMTFWGGEARRRSRTEPQEDIEMDEEEDETDSDESVVVEEDEDEDDGDEVDRMVLFGHR